MPRVAEFFEAKAMRSWNYRFLVIVSLLSAGTAWAKDLESRENAARAACLSGEYAKGVSILSQLFVETAEAVHIYNQGRCFEQNRRYEDAIARFQEFLRVGKKSGKGAKDDAQKHMADCQRLLAQQSSEATPGDTLTAKQSGKETKVRAAKKACLTGDPVAGVAILTDLYLDTNDPTHLFNQGRCFEQNRRYDDAIGRFREYLEKAKNLSPEEKADTQRHIANCDSYLREKPVEAATPAAPKVAVEKAPAVESKPAAVLMAAPAPSTGRGGSGLRAAGGVVAAVGVAGLVTGLVLNLKANSMSSNLEADWNPGTNSTREGYKTAGWIGYGGGAACLVAGTVLYYLGWRRGERDSSVALVPTAGPDMAGALVMGAF
jgi:TolA-binding protein